MLTARLGNAARAPGPVATPATASASAATALIPPAIMDQLHHAEALLASGKQPRRGGSRSNPLLSAYPTHAQLRVLSCKIELARGGAKDAKAKSRPASEPPGGRPRSSPRSRSRRRGSPRATSPARARCWSPPSHGSRPCRPPGPARRGSSSQRAIASSRPSRGPRTAVANAGVGAGADLGIAVWAAKLRVRYGLPRDGARWKLVPEDERRCIRRRAPRESRCPTTPFADAVKVAGRGGEAVAAAPRPARRALRCRVPAGRDRRGAPAVQPRASRRGRRHGRPTCPRARAAEQYSVAATRPASLACARAIDMGPRALQAWRALAQGLRARPRVPRAREAAPRLLADVRRAAVMAAPVSNLRNC